MLQKFLFDDTRKILAIVYLVRPISAIKIVMIIFFTDQITHSIHAPIFYLSKELNII